MKTKKVLVVPMNYDAVQEYSKVKREGAALYPDDIEGYIQYKNSIIEKIYQKCEI